MTTSFDCIAKLSERELLDHFAGLVARDRRLTAELLVAIAEIDERKLWAAHACSSMFTFCMERFHMSEQTTAKRLWAARTARRYPVILEMVARGELHLAAIHMLARHLTDENHMPVLERAKHKSCREVDRLIAEIAPRPDVPSRIRALPEARGSVAAAVGPASSETLSSGNVSTHDDNGRTVAGGSAVEAALVGETSSNELLPSNEAGNRPAAAWGTSLGGAFSRRAESRTWAKPIVPLSPRRYKIEITVDEATHDKLRSLQDLLARTETGRDPAAIVSRAIDFLLARTLARKVACTNRRRPSPATQPMTEGDAAHASGVATRSAAAEESMRKKACDAGTSSRARRRRHIPAAVRRAVWQRDSGRCCYEDARGRRCRETSSVEFHHKDPFAMGGLSTLENVELRCAAHNQFQADLDFGRTFMDAKRATRDHSARNVRDDGRFESWPSLAIASRGS